MGLVRVFFYFHVSTPGRVCELHMVFHELRLPAHPRRSSGTGERASAEVGVAFFPRSVLVTGPSGPSLCGRNLCGLVPRGLTILFFAVGSVS